MNYVHIFYYRKFYISKSVYFIRGKCVVTQTQVMDIQILQQSLDDALENSIDNLNVQLVKLCLERGANSNKILNNNEPYQVNTYMCLLSLKKDKEKILQIAKLLIQYGFNLSRCDSIFNCIRTHNYEFLNILLQNGANPNCVNSEQETPLIKVIENFDETNESIEYINLLLKHGSDISYLSNMQLNPLFSALQKNKLTFFKVTLENADNNIYNLKDLLDIRDGSNLLHKLTCCSINDSQDISKYNIIYKLLIDKWKVDLNQNNFKGDRPIDVCCYLEKLKIILSHSAIVNESTMKKAEKNMYIYNYLKNCGCQIIKNDYKEIIQKSLYSPPSSVSIDDLPSILPNDVKHLIIDMKKIIEEPDTCSHMRVRYKMKTITTYKEGYRFANEMCGWFKSFPYKITTKMMCGLNFDKPVSETYFETKIVEVVNPKSEYVLNKIKETFERCFKTEVLEILVDEKYHITNYQYTDIFVQQLINKIVNDITNRAINYVFEVLNKHLTCQQIQKYKQSTESTLKSHRLEYMQNTKLYKNDNLNRKLIFHLEELVFDCVFVNKPKYLKTFNIEKYNNNWIVKPVKFQ